MHRASSEEASLNQHRLLSPAHAAETDRQTRRREETPTPLLYLWRAVISQLKGSVVVRSSRPCLPAAAAAAVERLMYEHLF